MVDALRICIYSLIDIMMSVGVFHHIQREASALLVYRDGHTRASNRETSNKYRLSRFFYLCSNPDESIGPLKTY